MYSVATYIGTTDGTVRAVWFAYKTFYATNDLWNTHLKFVQYIMEHPVPIKFLFNILWKEH